MKVKITKTKDLEGNIVVRVNGISFFEFASYFKGAKIYDNYEQLSKYKLFWNGYSYRSIEENFTVIRKKEN